MSSPLPTAAVALVEVQRAPKERPGPPGGKRDINRRARTQAIASAALALFLEKGIEAVTIDDIAKEAKIAKGSFYRYFEDKTDVVAALIQPFGTVVRSALDRCEVAVRNVENRAALTTAYQRLALELAPVLLGELDAVRLYLVENRALGDEARAPLRDLALEIERSTIRLTELAVQKDLLRVPDPRISAIAVIGAVEQLAIAILSGRLDAPAPTVAISLVELMLGGLMGRPR